MNEILRGSIRALPIMVVMLAILILPASAQGSVSTIPPEVAGHANDWPLPNHDFENHRAAMNSTGLPSKAAGGMLWGASEAATAGRTAKRKTSMRATRARSSWISSPTTPPGTA